MGGDIRKIKFLTLGFDGGSLGLLKPWINRGRLPTLRRLLKQGSYGFLRSSVPPYTFPAWKCLTTGKSPCRLGVYWWLGFDWNSMKFTVNSSLSVRSLELWDYLNLFGYRCGVIGMPTTYPPSSIKGFMVSELAPRGADYARPRWIQELLDRELKYDASLWDYHGEDKVRVLRYAVKLILQRFGAARYLLKLYKGMLDFFNLTIFPTDIVQHVFWRNEDVLLGYWKLIDALLDDFLEEFADEDTYIFVFSDHGFTKLKYMFNIAGWLSDRGYLKIRSSYLKILSILRKLGLTPERFSYMLKGLEDNLVFSRLFNRKELIWTSYGKMIDWKRSKVIPLPGGVLYINRRLISGGERARLKENLIDELKEVKHKNRKIFRLVASPKEIYSCQSCLYAPDILALPNEGVEVVSRFDLNKTVIDKPSESGWDGVHSMNGLFIGLGPDMRSDNFVRDISLLDIAPTILYLFDAPLPRDLDGKIIADGLEKKPAKIKFMPPDRYRLLKSIKNLKEKLHL